MKLSIEKAKGCFGNKFKRKIMHKYKIVHQKPNHVRTKKIRARNKKALPIIKVLRNKRRNIRQKIFRKAV